MPAKLSPLTLLAFALLLALAPRAVAQSEAEHEPPAAIARQDSTIASEDEGTASAGDEGSAGVELPSAASGLTLEQALDLKPAVLTSSLRPLTLTEVEAELAAWLELLEQKAHELAQVEIQGLRAEDSEAIKSLSERAIELEAERKRLIERVEIVLASLEKKGGDPAGAQAYVKAMVVVPQISGWRALLARSRSWLTRSDGGIRLLIQVGIASGILFLGWVLGRILAALVNRALQRMSRTSSLLRDFVRMAVRNTVFALAAVVALNRLGVDMTPMLAAIGAAGLVVGLALQGTLSNFASGLLIMVYRPFDVGDVVSVAGVTGKVERMTLVSTALTTFDNQKIYLPNNSVWDNVITNVTESSTRRVDLVFGIDYGDDMAKAQKILEEVVAADDRVLDDPKPVIRVHELGESSVNFICRPWVRTSDYWNVYWDMTRTVKESFDAKGISIPFPQRTLHVASTPSNDGRGDRTERDLLYPQPPPKQAPAEPAPAEQPTET